MLITITVSIPLLVDYYFLIVSSAQLSVFRHGHGLLDIYIIEIYRFQIQKCNVIY